MNIKMCFSLNLFSTHWPNGWAPLFMLQLLLPDPLASSFVLTLFLHVAARIIHIPIREQCVGKVCQWQHCCMYISLMLC